MKLSIVVPVYNAEKFLRVCMDSLLAQTIGDFEIICIDDGSTDGSLAILGDYSLKYPLRIKVLSVKNGGQGRARNIGIDIASGDYIGFVDSDDWISADMYQKLYDAAVSEDADIVACDILQCFSDGCTLYHPAATGDGTLAAAGSASDKMFRRSFIGDVRFPEGKWYEDFVFSAKLLMKSKKTVFVKEPLYFYRIGQPSTMHNNNSRMNLDIISAVEDIRRFAAENGLLCAEDYLIINHILIDAVNRTAQQNGADRGEVLTKLREYVRANVPSLLRCEAFMRESIGRRTAMFLNYHGLQDITQLMLKLNAKLKHD